MDHQRKLTAIMFTDISGYSRKMSVDENLALNLLEIHNQIVEQEIASSSGTKIKTIGDAFMVRFDSALSAVRCAIAIQAALRAYNRDQPDDRQIWVRVGIHVGDVVEKEDDVFGDGVNVAARLEGKAEPGGICISETAYAVVRNALGEQAVKVVALGPQELKNIQYPVEIYLLTLDGGPSRPAVSRPPFAPRHRSARWLLVAAGIGLAIAAATGILLFGRSGSTPVAKAAAPDASASNSDLVAAFRAVTPAIADCYTAALKAGEDFDGELRIKIQIDDAGRVTTMVDEDKLGSPGVAACAMTQVQSMKVTDAMKGTKASYPVKFAPTRTLAILPFTNLVGDPSSDWVRAAVAEALFAKLGQLSKIVVVDRARLQSELAKLPSGASAEASVTAATAAGARLVVAGAFQKVGSKIHLSANLYQRDGKLRATVEADGQFDDLFTLEDDLAKRLVESLNIPLSGDSKAALAVRTGSSLAILELLGKASLALSGTGEPIDLKKAEALFRQAISLDPTIPEAHYGLGRALWNQKKSDPGALPALEEAVRLRSDYYEAMTMLGFALWANDQPERAKAIQTRAVQLKPQYAPGYYGLALSHASLGDADQALALIARAAELDPNQPEYLTQRGLWTALFRRDFVEGGRLTEAATRAKNASEWGDLVHGYVRLMAGDAAGCLANLADAAKVRPPTGKYQERKAIETACTLKAGDEQAARALYAQVDAKSREYLEKGCPKEMPEFLKIEIKDLAAILKPIMPVGHALVPKP